MTTRFIYCKALDLTVKVLSEETRNQQKSKKTTVPNGRTSEISLHGVFVITPTTTCSPGWSVLVDSSF